jgi:hypothetical protein
MRRPLSILLGSLFLLSASAGHAADPNNLKEAQRRFDDGVRLLNAKDFEHARLAFAEAAALVRTPSALYNEAYCEFYSGHNVESLNHFRELLREPKAKPENVELAKTTFIPQLVPKVGQITIEAPQGASIDVDKEKVGMAPVPDPVAVEGGSTHRVIALVGGETLTKEIPVGRGETVHVILGTASPATSAPASASALDDIPARIERPSTMSTSPVGEQRDSTPDQDAERKRYIVSGVFAGATVLLAIGSVSFFVAANSSNSDVNAAQAAHPGTSCYPNGCADLNSALDDRHSRAIWGTVLASGAGVAAIGTGLSWYLLRPKAHSSSASMEFSPSLVPGHTGFLLQGSF